MTTLRLQSTLTYENHDNNIVGQTSATTGALFTIRRPATRLGLQLRNKWLRNCSRQFIPARNALPRQTTGLRTEDGVSTDGLLEQCCRRLRVDSAEELQDLIASLILSECVYKKLELDEEGVVAKVAEFASQFPPGWVQLEAVQLSLSGIPQHYLIATSPTSMYVAFMGTKQFQDILADANLLHTPVWAESARLAADQQSIPAAHRGFLDRARAIHVEQLYELAVSRGLRLVLCGHSLGGAVAKLCALRLLRELPDWPRPRLRCIAFATPAVGNAALAELVENAGWASHFATYYLPEDQLVRLISFSQARTTMSSTVTAGRPRGGGGDARGGSGGRVRRVKGGAPAELSSGRPPAAATPGLGGGGGVSGGGVRPNGSAAVMSAAAAAAGVPQLLGSAVASAAVAVRPAMLRSPSDASTFSEAGDRRRRRSSSSGGDSGGDSGSYSTNSLGSVSSRSLLRGDSLGGSSTFSEGGGVASSVGGSSPLRLTESGSGRNCGSSVGGAADCGADAAASGLSRSGSGVSGFFAASLTSWHHGLRQGLDLAPVTGGFPTAASLPRPPWFPAAASPPAAVQRGGSSADGGGVGGGGSGGSSNKRSMTESLDEDQSGVATAMEEILAPGPDAMEAAAATGLALTDQPPADLAVVQRTALYGNAGGSWGLRLALERKRLVRRVRRMAARARIPLPKALLPVSRYHTFGEQWFITERGALTPEELELRHQQEREKQRRNPQQQQQQQQQQQPAASAEPPDGSRGFFSFHRMVAYRQRHVEFINGLINNHHKAASVEEYDREAREGGALSDTLGTSADRPTTQPAQPEASPVAGHVISRVKVNENLVPRIVVHRAVLRGALLDPLLNTPEAARHTLTPNSPTLPSPSPSPSSTGSLAASSAPSMATSASTGGFIPAPSEGGSLTAMDRSGSPVAHLLSWVTGGAGHAGGGGRHGRGGGPEDPVRLEIEIEGNSLQYCRTVSVSLVRPSVVDSPLQTPKPLPGGFVWQPAPSQAPGTPGGTSAAPTVMPYNAVHALPSPGCQPASASSGTTVETELPCEVVQVLYVQPYSDTANPPPLHPMSLLRNSLHHMAGSLIRRCWLHHPFQPGGPYEALGLKGAAPGPVPSRGGGPWRRFRFRTRTAGAVGLTPEGGGGGSSSSRGSGQEEDGKAGTAGTTASCAADVPPEAAMPSRLLLRVTLPQSVAQGLLDGSLPGHLAVSARSDFHAVSSVPVVVQRARVAILGTSPYAASLVQAALAAPAALAAAELDERMAAAAGAAAGGAAGLAWLPSPLAWVLSSMRGRAVAGASTAEESATAAAAGLGQDAGVALVDGVASAGLAPGRTGAAAAFESRHPAVAVAAATHGPADAAPQPSPLQTTGLKLAHGSPQQAPAGVAPTTAVLNQPPDLAAAAGSSSVAAITPSARPPLGSARLPYWQIGLVAHLRWGFRQSLAAAAIGAAAASAGGATSVVAAVGVTAALVSTLGTVAAAGSEGGTTLLTNAAIAVAAVLAAGAAATASALAGGEAAALVAAGVAAAVVAAVAAAAAPTVAAVGGAHAPSGLSAATAAAVVAGPALAKARPLVPGLPALMQAPRLSSSKSATTGGGGGSGSGGLGPARLLVVGATLAAAPSQSPGSATAAASAAGPRAMAAPPSSHAPGPRWAIRFAGAAGQADARDGGGGTRAQARARGAGSGASAAAGAAESGAGDAVRSIGRGWSLWWRGGGPVGVERGAEGAPRAVAATAVGWSAPPPMALPPQPAPPAWLPWQRTTGSGSRTRGVNAAGALAGGKAAPTTSARTPTPSATAAAVARGAPHERLENTAGWFEGQSPTVTATAFAAGARQTSPMPPSTFTSAPPTPLSTPSSSPPLQPQTQPQGGGTVPRRAAPLAQLRSQLLAGMRQGSGRSVLPLPPVVISEGLELCNVMVKPAAPAASASPSSSSGRPAVPWPQRRPPVPRSEGPSGQQPPRAPSEAVASAGGASARSQVPEGQYLPAPTVSMSSSLQAAVPARLLWRWSRREMYDSPPYGLPVAGRPARAGAGGAATAAGAIATAAVTTAAAQGDTFSLQAAVVGLAPYIAVRQMAQGLRRQVLQRGWWWRWLLGGVMGALLRPVALVGLLGRLPAWGLQALRRMKPPPAPIAPSSAAAPVALPSLEPQSRLRPRPQPQAPGYDREQGPCMVSCGAAAASLGAAIPAMAEAEAGQPQTGASDWGALVIVASCRDPLRVLRSRDMEELRNQAASAGCPVVPVVLTCAQSPLGRALAARRTLAAAVGVDPSVVRIVCLDADLLHRPAAAIPRADLMAVWRGTAACDGASELRQAVRQAVAAATAAAAVQETGLQPVPEQWQQQQRQSLQQPVGKDLAGAEAVENSDGPHRQNLYGTSLVGPPLDAGGGGSGQVSGGVVGPAWMHTLFHFPARIALSSRDGKRQGVAVEAATDAVPEAAWVAKRRARTHPLLTTSSRGAQQ